MPESSESANQQSQSTLRSRNRRRLDGFVIPVPDRDEGPVEATPPSRFEAEPESEPTVVVFTAESVSGITSISDRADAPHSPIEAPEGTEPEHSDSAYVVRTTVVQVSEVDEDDDEFGEPVDLQSSGQEAEESPRSLAEDPSDEVSMADSVSEPAIDATDEPSTVMTKEEAAPAPSTSPSASSTLSFDSIFDDDLGSAPTQPAAGVIDDDFDIMAFGKSTPAAPAPSDSSRDELSGQEVSAADQSPRSEPTPVFTKTPDTSSASGSRDFQPKPSTEVGSTVTFEPLPLDFVEDNEHLASQAERLKVSHVLMNELGSHCYVDLDQDGSEGYEGWVYRNNLSLRVHVNSSGEARFRTSKLRRRISASRAREMLAQADKTHQGSGSKLS